MRCWKESARHEHTDFFGRIPVVQSCGEVLLPPVDHVAYVHAHMLHVHVHLHVRYLLNSLTKSGRSRTSAQAYFHAL